MLIVIFSPVSVDYQSAKAARRVNKKVGVDEQEKIRHISGASHCSSDKSVGDLDAAESLIVLSSTAGQKEKSKSNFLSDEQTKSKSLISLENNLSNQSKEAHNTVGPRKEFSESRDARYLVNGNPMDLSPATMPPLQTNPMHTKMQNYPLQPGVTSIPDPSKLHANTSHCGSNYLPSVSLPTQNVQHYQQPLHRQIMTVSGPVTDHVALVDTVLNQPSAPTMVIPMDDQDKINRVNPNNMLFSGSNFNSGNLVTGQR